MKIVNLLQFARQYLVLKNFSWVLLVITLILNAIIWYIWLYKTQFSKITLYYSTAVLLINIILTFIFSRKDELVEYLFILSAFIVQVYILILLYHTIY